MSVRSYTKIWLHLIWGTKNREKILLDKSFRKEISKHITENAQKKNIFMKVNYVNSDHVHALIDLPTNMTVEDTARLIKGESSSWINKNADYKFNWSTGYGAFSVSESNLNKVVKYILNQEEHHRTKSFAEEYDEFLKAYNIELG
ncbi:MAG: IS200/IS605 family transposase [Ignavibacteriae bacterium]|nr:IS200/IS605 family transposase [Ignavibacteriota bacterium]NOG98689.1 IS200/IS605 family transposase [Ignavibacteriota bacterium]